MKLRLIAALQDVAEAGALASSCGNQLKALASQHECALITNGALPSDLPSVPIVVLPLPSLHWLGGHRQVPRQVVFWLMVGIVLGLSRRTRGVDLVLVHSHPAIAMLAPLLQRLRGFKMVLVMHGDINDHPPGTDDRLLTWWYRICTAPAYRWADAVLALSPYMADLAIRGGAEPHKVHLAPNGLDAEEICLEQLPPPPQGQNRCSSAAWNSTRGSTCWWRPSVSWLLNTLSFSSPASVLPTSFISSLCSGNCRPWGCPAVCIFCLPSHASSLGRSIGMQPWW